MLMDDDPLPPVTQASPCAYSGDSMPPTVAVAGRQDEVIPQGTCVRVLGPSVPGIRAGGDT